MMMSLPIADNNETNALAGVVVALFIPARGKYDTETFTGKVKAYLNRIVRENDCGHSILMNQQHLDAVQAIEIACSNVETPLQRLEHHLQSWVAYLVLPLFALANSGLALRQLDMFTAIRHPVTLGVAFGLVSGKPLGIVSFTYLGSKLLQAPLLHGIKWSHIVGVGLLGGIGFTMSLFISGLSFTSAQYRIFPNLVSLPDRLYPVLPVGLCWAFWEGPYLPCRYGIATFMTDLVESLSAQVHDIDIGAAAMNDKPERRIKMSAKRDAYMEKLKAPLDKWNADIDKLAAKAAQEKKKAKVEYQKQLDDLLAKRDDVRDKLSAMQQAGEGAWEDLKEGLDNSWEILKMSFDKAKSEFEKEYKKGTKA
jgi:hypothetical protein